MEQSADRGERDQAAMLSGNALAAFEIRER
jgi:hypothetical protein